MAHCYLIFVLDDGTELLGEEIDKHLHLFPKGIIEKVEPIVAKARISTTIDWHASIVRVYQNGKTESFYNVPPKKRDFI